MYPPIPHRRHVSSPTMDQTEYTGFAANAHSAWEVARLGRKLVVVHDVERQNPVIADIVMLK